MYRTVGEHTLPNIGTALLFFGHFAGLTLLPALSNPASRSLDTFSNRDYGIFSVVVSIIANLIMYYFIYYTWKITQLNFAPMFGTFQYAVLGVYASMPLAENIFLLVKLVLQ